MAIVHVSDMNPAQPATHKVTVAYAVTALADEPGQMKTATLELTEEEAAKVQAVLDEIAAHAAPENAPAVVPARPATPVMAHRPARVRNRTGGTTANAGQRSEDQAIREWGRKQGLKVSDRGRLPDGLRERYAAAHRPAKAAAVPAASFSATK
jgi:hypothetical protein